MDERHLSRRGFLVGGSTALALTLAGCGGSGDGTIVDPVATWTRLPDLPAPRTEVAAAEFQGLLVVAGGYDAAGASSASVVAFSPTPRRWDAITSLPAGRNHLALASVAGRLFAVAGYGPPDNNPAPTTDLWEYDAAAFVWRSRAPLPLARAAHAAVALGGKLYVVGGVGPSAAVTLSYDPVVDSWSQRAPIPTEREHLAAAPLPGGRLLAVGGRVGVTNLAAAEIYDPAQDRWQAAAALPLARSGLTAATVNGQVYVTGGETLDGSGTTFGRLDIFTPGTGFWTEGPALPIARHGLGSVEYQGRFYVFAGGPVAGLSVSAVAEVFGF
ncbi:MAG TPA: kelch repeat-containing protein [Armatimonadaceae bacterium]|nr:kelch repeat-containing protein [Armatimonadaceae bacterium]